MAQPRAPAGYYVWVEGKEYGPGQFLPGGTTEYEIRDTVYLSDYTDLPIKQGQEWRTVSFMAAVGSSKDDIDEMLSDVIDELLETYGLEP